MGAAFYHPPFSLVAMSSDVHNTLIKICGLTREADVLACVQAGANAIGFVIYPPRCLLYTSDAADEASIV
jgi:hypothetical protein